MLRDKELRLVTLGRLALLRTRGEADVDVGTGARRRELALLALLAISGRPLSRDQLTEMFWGGQPEERARHSLSNALSQLRRLVGRDAIAARSAEVELEAAGRLSVDALDLTAAAAAREDERTVELYGGAFLAGVYVDGSSSFEQWVAGERTRLEGCFLAAAQRRCMALMRSRKWDECAELSRRWLEAAPVSGDAALFRLNALRMEGSRECNQRALAEYDRIRDLLQREYDLRPDRAVTELARSIAEQLAATGAADGATGEYRVVVNAATTAERAARIPPPAPATPQLDASRSGETPATASPTTASPATASPTDAPTPDAPATEATAPRSDARAIRWWLRPRQLAAAAVLIGVVAVGTIASRALTPGLADANGPPRLAIIDIGFLGGDSANVWIAEGLPRMLAAKLQRSHTLELVDPERVRELRAEAGLTAGSVISADRARDLASRLGATWVVTGAVVDADTTVQLDLLIRDVRDGRVVRQLRLQERNVLALAEGTAWRLLDAAGASRPGPQIADIETPSVQAYEHYIRYLQLRSENRQESMAELDAAVATDSGFISALRARLEVARDANDVPTMLRLDSTFQRYAYRATDWDRLSIAASDAMRSGSWPRAEAAARALVERFPRDPRAWRWLAQVYTQQGRWRDGERAHQAQLALDSVTTVNARGPCVPCAAYGELSVVRLAGLGDVEGAERAVQQLLALQPELASGWAQLAFVRAAQGRADDAIAAQRRALAFAPLDVQHRTDYGRLLIMLRRHEAADSAIMMLAADTTREIQANVAELRTLLERERGRYRAALPWFAAMKRLAPYASQVNYMRGENEARANDLAAAARSFDELSRLERASFAQFQAPDLRYQPGVSARGLAWRLALEVDALAATFDTARLRTYADSIEQLGLISFYGRDRLLHRHVRGLIATRAERWEEAEEHFHAARFGAWGWTRSVVEEAKAQLAQHRPHDAVATLRSAYLVPLDGMGRYVPRSELDYWMAHAFAAASQGDSAAVYAGYVRRAWRDADPHVRALVTGLPQGAAP